MIAPLLESCFNLKRFPRGFVHFQLSTERQEHETCRQQQLLKIPLRLKCPVRHNLPPKKRPPAWRRHERAHNARAAGFHDVGELSQKWRIQVPLTKEGKKTTFKCLIVAQVKQETHVHKHDCDSHMNSSSSPAAWGGNHRLAMRSEGQNGRAYLRSERLSCC